MLFTLALVFFSAHPSVHFTGPFAPKDVKEIQRGVRQEMWRRAFPRFSMQTIAAAPKLLWSLATSRVEQIDVFEGGQFVRVRVRSPLGDHIYGMSKSFPKPGQPSWRITGGRPAGPWLKEADSWGGYAKLPLKGGFGLIGGRLPQSFVTPVDYYSRTHPSVPFEPRSLDSNQISLSYVMHPLILDKAPSAITCWQDPAFPADRFSGSLSNLTRLQLR